MSHITCPRHLNQRHPHDGVRTRRLAAVVGVTAVTMVVEIAAGWVWGSMALLADGVHMATHAGALGISLLAYRVAARHQDNRSYNFGTGKVGALAGFANAVILAMVALLMIVESAHRLINPAVIAFDEALVVAMVGLAVNLASMFLLQEPHDHRHHHGHDHSHDHDHNYRSAYLHVAADALTSVLAIAALLCGKLWGLGWLDPVMGIVGALVILAWSRDLVKATSSLLLDRVPEAIMTSLRRKLDEQGAVVEDLHVWAIGPGAYSAVMSVRAAPGLTAQSLHDALAPLDLAHLTIEMA